MNYLLLVISLLVWR